MSDAVCPGERDLNDPQPAGPDEHHDSRPQATLEDEMRRRYLEQQRQMLCPGCGDSEGPF